MNITSKKDECNYKYVQLLEKLRNKSDLKEIHKLMLDISELLCEIGRLVPQEADKSKRIAIAFVKIAKTINTQSRHEDIYFQMTGKKLETTSAVTINKVNENIASASNSPDLVHNEKVAGNVNNIVTRQNVQDNIRPSTLNDFIGQDKVKTQLKEAIDAAKIKGLSLEHILFFGSAGLGKTSLSKIIANEMNSNMVQMSGPTIKDVQDIVEVVKDIREGDIVFIDEIHRLNSVVAEALYTAMEDFEISFVEKNKEGVRPVTLSLPHFTIIGATTHSGLLQKPMRDRFALQFKLDAYGVQDLMQIATNSLSKLGKSINKDASYQIAIRSRGIPRICNNFVKRICDRALVRKINEIDVPFVLQYFNDVEINEQGLTVTDLEYMKIIYKKFGNKAVGIDNLASCLNEGKNIIENQIEPYLLYLGFIQITPNGRLLTDSGLKYVANLLGENLEIKQIPTATNTNETSNLKEMIADIINSSIDKKLQTFVPSTGNVKDNKGDIKYSVQFFIDNAQNDDELIPPASILYSEIEQNLINKFGLQHKNTKFVMDYDEYIKYQDIVNHNSSNMSTTNGTAPKDIKVRVVEYNLDGSPQIVEMPPIIRFIKAGLNVEQAKKATIYWSIINKIRHKSPQNTQELDNYLASKALTKKQILTEAFMFYKANALYDKD